jgi:hypothetical protein
VAHVVTAVRVSRNEARVCFGKLILNNVPKLLHMFTQVVRNCEVREAPCTYVEVAEHWW